MTNEQYLLDAAKIAISIVGFVGVVGALRHPRDEGWRPNELAGAKLMLEHSVAAVVAGLLPSVLMLYFNDERVVWLWASALLAVFFAYAVLINIVRVRSTSGAGSPPRSFYLLLSTFFVPTLVALYLQFENARSWNGPLAFAAGVLWLLIAACVQFTHFLLHVKPSGEAQPLHRADVKKAAPFCRRSCRTTRASPFVKRKHSSSRAAARFTSGSSCRTVEPLRATASSPRSGALRRDFGQGCGRTNYKRSSMQRWVLRTLMKDARGGLIR